MPDYSPIEEIDQSQPLDMSNIKYSAGTIFGAAASNVQSSFITKSIVNNLNKINPNPDIPSSYPADQEFIDNIKKDRPGFNAPVGLPQFVVGSLAAQYDNNKYFSKVSSSPSSIMGKVGAFGGGIIGSFADPKQLIYGLSGAAAAEAVLAPIAERYLANFAASKIIGSGVAKVGTAISSNAAGGAGFGFAGNVSEISDELKSEDILGEPHHYVDKLQNLGNATLYGAIAGIGFHAAGRGVAFGRDALIGKKVEIAPEQSINIPPDERFTIHNRYGNPDEAQAAAEAHAKESPIPHDYRVDEAGNGDYILSKKGKGATIIKPATYERQGGLLSKLELPERTKQVLAKLSKPWTRAADDVTKTEAVGQMANGSLVDLEPVIKQGMYDEGVAFKDELVKEGIDPSHVDESLAATQEQIISEMFQRHFAEQEGLGKKIPTPEEQQNIFQPKNSNPVELPRDGTSDTINQEALSAINEKIKFNKDVIDRLDRAADKAVRGKVNHGEYTRIRTEQNLHRWAVKNLKADRETLLSGNRQKIKDLHDEYVAAQHMRDSLSDEHKPLSQGEMQAYGEHLKKSNMPDNGYSIEAGDNHTVDEQLKQYTDQDMKTLAEQTESSDVGGKEIERSAEKLRNQKVYDDMAQNMTDCILKGGL